jgi:hypothetical protein
MRWTFVAIAIALSIWICAGTWAQAAEQRVPLDFSAAATDADLGGGAEPPAGEQWFVMTDTAAPERELFSAASTKDDVTLPPLRAEGASAVAPLPPAVFMGMLGIGMVAFASYRLKKRARM